VFAESFARCRRSILLGLGRLPLQHLDGQHAETLGLTGEETFDIIGVSQLNTANHLNAVRVRAGAIEFDALVRIDTPSEAAYYRHGGIMQYVLRSLLH